MIVSPVLGLFQSLRTNNRNVQRWILILFITFYGSIINLSIESDGYRHAQNVHDHYIGLSFDQFISELYDIIAFKSNYEINEDVFIHVVSYFSGEILRAPGLFFTIISFIYGYFFIGSMFRVFKSFPKIQNGILFFGFALIFILWKNIEAINTVRTWTGMWVLFYSCISYYETKKIKYIFLMFLPPLFHVGYFIMAIPAWIVLIFGSRKIIYSIVFIGSFFFTFSYDNVILKKFTEQEVGKEKVEAYYLDPNEYQKQITQSKKDVAWYAKYQNEGYVKLGLLGITFLLILSGAYFVDFNKIELKLFSIGILAQAFSNVMVSLYAVSQRSGAIAGLFILATIVLLFQRNYFAQLWVKKSILRAVLWGCFLILVPFIIFKAADLIFYISVFVFFAPFVIWFDPDYNLSIRELINDLFKY